MTDGVLDLLYTPSRFVPDMDGYVREYADRSAAARSELRWHEHTYGPEPAERLLFFPAGDTLQVFVHGGYWQESSKEDSCFAARDFVTRGISFAAIGYGLAPRYRLDEIVTMVRRGLLWIHRCAEALGVDRDRIFLSGSSAGAQLVAMCLTREWLPESLRDTELVRGATLLSGLYDLEPLRATYIGEAIGLTAEQSARNSPVRHVHGGLPPLVLAHGADEPRVFAEQQGHYLRALDDAGIRTTDLAVPGHDHFDLPFGLGDPSHPLGAEVERLMRR